MVAVPVVRSDLRLDPDPRRRIVKAFLPGGRNPDDGRTRVEHILDRVLDMSAEDRSRTLAEVRARFDARHEDLDAVLRIGFRAVRHWIDHPAALSEDVHDLVGAYFVHEYSVEAAALTNPSLVPAPDQSDVPDGSLRVVVSLRAIGEGHISSIEFRTAVVGPEGKVVVEPARAPVPGTRRTPLFDKPLFTAKLHEVGADGGQGLIARVLDRLGETFTMEELESALGQLDASDLPPTAVQHVSQTMHWLAASNYELVFPPTSFLSQRVIFPAGPSESRGMEDARFVRFEEDDGSVLYYATYTAYDGFTRPAAADRDRGLQDVPHRHPQRRRCAQQGDGDLPAAGRRPVRRARALGQREQLRHVLRQRPLLARDRAAPGPDPAVGADPDRQLWSTDRDPEGWLVITHGVGPLRTYALGAILLDLDDPAASSGTCPSPCSCPRRTNGTATCPTSSTRGDRSSTTGV
jgi:hypothetical protein